MSLVIASSDGLVSRTLGRVRASYHAAMPHHRLRRYVGDAADIPTYTSVRERLLLFDEATTVLSLSPQACHIVEVGSYLGASAAVLAEVLRRERPDNGRLYCIDTWNNDAMSEGVRDTYEQFRANTSRWQDLITPIRSSSTQISLHESLQVALVFVDGDHSYEMVTADINRFAPHIIPEGRLILHDHRSKPGVARALGNLLESGQWVIQRCVESLVSLRRAPWTTTTS